MEGDALEVEELSVDLLTPRGAANVLDRVSFRLQPGAALGIVGESASGKTLLGLAVGRVLPEVAQVVGGRVRLAGQALLALQPEALRAVRGGGLAMVFQEPMAALNPLLTVGRQLTEVLELHGGVDRGRAQTLAVELLASLDVPDPAGRLASYPGQLSKGTAQRVLMALALAGEPRVLIADEPTASQDRERRERVLAVLGDHRRRRGMALLLISHELDVVRAHADEVLVLHRGQVAEYAATAELFRNPQHPYTVAMLGAERVLRDPSPIPSPSGGGEPWPADHLRPVATHIRRTPPSPFRGGDGGEVPSWLSGCRYRDRCPRQTAECAQEAPRLAAVSSDHRVACYHPGPGP